MIILYDGWNDLRENHNPIQLLENRKDVCELGKTNNFDLVIDKVDELRHHHNYPQ